MKSKKPVATKKHKQRKKDKPEKLSRNQINFLKKVPTGFRPPAYMFNPDEHHVRVIKSVFIGDWLIAGWKITSQSAWRKFGVTRLADVVYQMRERGFKIKTTMIKGRDRFQNKVFYAEYKLNKSKSKKAIARYKALHTIKKKGTSNL